MMLALRHYSNLIIIFTITIIFTHSQPTHVAGLGIGSTISVSYGSNTICGILAGNVSSQSISCYTQGQITPIPPTNLSFSSISGGQDFFCGLTSGGATLLCWVTSPSPTAFVPITLYTNETAPLSGLSVGDAQVCALQINTGTAQCWQRDPMTLQFLPFTPPNAGTQFTIVTSGGGFSCGVIKGDGNVACWGQSGIGDFIESEFGSSTMLTLVAGKAQACGLSTAGDLVCKGNNDTGQLNSPEKAADFSFESLALGGNSTCAVERTNGSVVCWGGKQASGGGLNFIDVVVAGFSFETVVAGLDFTCGLTRDFSVICWGPGWPTANSFSMSQIPLATVIPGPCVQDPCGECGLYPNTTSLCFGSGSHICESCLSPLPPPPPILPPSPSKASPNQPPGNNTLNNSQKPKSESAANPPYWIYNVFGAIGVALGLFAVFFIIRSRKRGKRSKKFLDTSGSNSNVPLNIRQDSADSRSYPSTAPNSRSSSITYVSAQSLQPKRSLSSIAPPSRVDRFSLASLASATENFSDNNIIGTGSFGTVYRGRLSDGRSVAVKREEMVSEKKMKLNADGEKDDAFESELELLSRLHHKHLVGLEGFCQEKDERLLVYEYMSNGSLHDYLHTDKASTTLNSWKTRIKITLDAARGVEYLHNYAVPPIIHRDIKSSNILLDANWIARVSDFGLSLMGPPSDQDDLLVSTSAVGTVGYIDPEYYVSKVLTTKSDVYGFGVVLLETLTGKKAVFRSSEGLEPVGLVEYVSPFVIGGEAWKVLDKRVGYPQLNEAEAVELVAQTALRCVSLEGKDRPSMSEVVTNLEKAFILCKESSSIGNNNSFKS